MRMMYLQWWEFLDLDLSVRNTVEIVIMHNPIRKF